MLLGCRVLQRYSYESSTDLSILCHLGTTLSSDVSKRLTRTITRTDREAHVVRCSPLQSWPVILTGAVSGERTQPGQFASFSKSDNNAIAQTRAHNVQIKTPKFHNDIIINYTSYKRWLRRSASATARYWMIFIFLLISSQRSQYEDRLIRPRDSSEIFIFSRFQKGNKIIRWAQSWFINK